MNATTTAVLTWTTTGVLAGAIAACGTRRALTRDDAPRPAILTATGAAATGLAFALLAARLDGIELLAYSYLAAVGVMLSTIDILEHRLPSRLVLPSYVVVGGLLTIAATRAGDLSNLWRSLLAATALAGAYLLVALISRGGLGSGDVKLGGLLGLAMGWQGWPVVLAGTLTAWTAAALVLILTRRPTTTGRPDPFAMGPFLFGGTGLALALG